MPEGHTIHRLAPDHTGDLVGPPVAACSPQGRFAEGAALLDGGTVDHLEARQAPVLLVALWDTLKSMLTKGVAQNRIVTIDRKELKRGPTRGRGGRATYVYGRPDCLRCGAGVQRWEMAGRWAYACPRCQPLPATGPPR